MSDLFLIFRRCGRKKVRLGRDKSDPISEKIGQKGIFLPLKGKKTGAEPRFRTLVVFYVIQDCLRSVQLMPSSTRSQMSVLALKTSNVYTGVSGSELR